MRAAFILAAAIGCGGDIAPPGHSPLAIASIAGPDIPVWVDYRFSDGERAAVTEAFDRWNVSLNGNANLHIQSYDFDAWPEVLNHIQETGEGIVVYDQPTCRGFYGGWVDEIGGHFIRACQFPPETLRGIIMHEIGHILGLTHVSQKGSLMFGTVHPGTCIDGLTVDQMRRVRGWEIVGECP